MLGRAVAGLNAYSKGVSLGLLTPAPPDVREKRAKPRSKERLTVICFTARCRRCTQRGAYARWRKTSHPTHGHKTLAFEAVVARGYSQRQLPEEYISGHDLGERGGAEGHVAHVI